MSIPLPQEEDSKDACPAELPHKFKAIDHSEVENSDTKENMREKKVTEHKVSCKMDKEPQYLTSSAKLNTTVLLNLTNEKIDFQKNKEFSEERPNDNEVNNIPSAMTTKKLLPDYASKSVAEEKIISLKKETTDIKICAEILLKSVEKLLEAAMTIMTSRQVVQEKILSEIDNQSKDARDIPIETEGVAEEENDVLTCGVTEATADENGKQPMQVEKEPKQQQQHDKTFKDENGVAMETSNIEDYVTEIVNGEADTKEAIDDLSADTKEIDNQSKDARDIPIETESFAEEDKDVLTCGVTEATAEVSGKQPLHVEREPKKQQQQRDKTFKDENGVAMETNNIEGYVTEIVNGEADTKEALDDLSADNKDIDNQSKDARDIPIETEGVAEEDKDVLTCGVTEARADASGKQTMPVEREPKKQQQQRDKTFKDENGVAMETNNIEGYVTEIVNGEADTKEALDDLSADNKVIDNQSKDARDIPIETEGVAEEDKDVLTCGVTEATADVSGKQPMHVEREPKKQQQQRDKTFKDENGVAMETNNIEGYVTEIVNGKADTKEALDDLSADNKEIDNQSKDARDIPIETEDFAEEDKDVLTCGVTEATADVSGKQPMQVLKIPRQNMKVQVREGRDDRSNIQYPIPSLPLPDLPCYEEIRRQEEMYRMMQCIICRFRPRNTLFVYCMHIITCGRCSEPMVYCPSCGQPVVAKRRVLLA